MLDRLAVHRSVKLPLQFDAGSKNGASGLGKFVRSYVWWIYHHQKNFLRSGCWADYAWINPVSDVLDEELSQRQARRPQ
jgi:hypothetical protein